MKISEFQKEMEELGTEASVFLCDEPIHDSNIMYFTGFRQTKFHSFSCLIITIEKSVLLVSRLEYDRALKEAKADEIINLKDYDNNLAKFLKVNLKNVKRVGIVPDLFPYYLGKKLRGKKFQDISPITRKLRSIKTKKEIDLLKKSCSIASRGVKLLEQELKPGITERELALMLEKYLLERADAIAFPTILTSGKRSSYIHPEPNFSSKKISRGLGLVDFGVVYRGYCSDITVPFSIGKLSEKEEAILSATELAYNIILENLGVGRKTWEIFHEGEKILKREGFELKHSIGHGLGLDVHEDPNLSPQKKTRKKLFEPELKENMIFTVEPGVYLPNIGGSRLENDILMTRKGPKILTRSKVLEV
ncbi:MAG: Xaa-Pro peptidase family protein [Candidatus Aenigmatarchaeota archaeon]